MYIIAAIVSASVFAIMFRICALWKADIWSAMAVNYAVGTLVFGKELIGSGSGVVLLGVVAACLFVLGFIVRDRCTARNGIALATVASRSSLVVPVILGWLVLGERQPVWIAAILALAGIVMLSCGSSKTRMEIGWEIPVLFLVYGLCNFALPVASHMRMASGSVTGCIFAVATALSAGICLKKGFRGGYRSLAAGTVMGAANAGSVYFSLEALGTTDATLFYPVLDAGVVTICTAAAFFLFGERPAKVQTVGLAMAISGILASYI